MIPASTTPIDEELAALREGKTSAACAKIVALHGPLVKAACRRVLRDEGLAEDAAQETFVLLVKKAKSLPPGTSLAGWLYHAACRTALNHQRTAMRRRARENSAEAINQMTPDTQPNLWTEIEPHLDEAMLALPERQRDLVVQCYFQSQSQRSAAAALGCSESVVSRELSAAIEALRLFFAKRKVTVSGVTLTGLLSTHAASATMVGSAAAVKVMMATTATAALLTSKLVLVTAAVAGTATIAVLGYHWHWQSKERQGRQATASPHSSAGFATVSNGPNGARGKSVKGKAANAGAAWQGAWEGSFQFTSAMALDEQKKKVLLEGDADVRYELLQKMGVRLSRAAFDALIAKGLDASVAPWRDTFTVLANRTEMFDNYLMAWSNEDPLGALNWVASQPDGGLGLRKQLLYVLANQQLQPEALRHWIDGLTTKSLKNDAMLALQSIDNPAMLIAQMGTGGNEGFLVDLAMLQGDRLDWNAFGRKLAMGRGEIVARAMRQVLDGAATAQNLDQLIQGLAQSPNANISEGAVNILRAARGEANVDYRRALQLAVTCDQAGMSDFSAAIFQGWAKAHPVAAIQYAAGLKDLAGLREVMHNLAAPPDEATLMSWMAASPSKARDIALSNLYGLHSDGPFDLLQKITQSATIIDQVEAAKEVMRTIPLHDAASAAEWLKQLPAGKDRQELAFALARRLSVVDPQATLTLVQSAGLRGQDYSIVVNNAVAQFAAQNNLAQSTQFIQQIQDPKMYADALGQLAMVKFPGHAQEAFVFLQTHSRGDWQSAALHMLSDTHYNKLGNIDANAAAILKLDLPSLGPDVTKRATVLCKAWIDHHVPVEVPLTWVQQLPAGMGRDTRLQLARELKPMALSLYHQWVQNAPLAPAERTQLLKVLDRRIGEHAR